MNILAVSGGYLTKWFPHKNYVCTLTTMNPGPDGAHTRFTDREIPRVWKVHFCVYRSRFKWLLEPVETIS